MGYKANAEVADEFGNSELARIWQLASQVASAAAVIGEESEEGGGWANCPMGKPLLSSLLSHHLQCKDFQTVALLICAFTKQTMMKPQTPLKSPQEPLPQLAKDKFWFLKSGALTGTTPGGLGDSPYHTVHSAGPGYSATVGGGQQQQRVRLEEMFEPPRSPRHRSKPGRSNSWTDAAPEEVATLSPGSSSGAVSLEAVVEVAHGESRWQLLDEAQWPCYSRALAAYTDALYNWGLLEQRAIVRKHGQSLREEASRAAVSTSCPTCESHLSRASCNRCRRPGLSCSVCRVPVLGLAVVCPACGHGGHLAHLNSWWINHATCPASCGCPCRKFL